MRKESNTKKNLSPAISCKASWRLTKVKALDHYKLEVEFNDGVQGYVEMDKCIKKPTSGVFAKLKDIKVFNKVYLMHGAVTWPNNIDLAPDTMHDEIKHHGKWILK